jgi:DNA-binding SARP family transcriptional activator
MLSIQLLGGFEVRVDGRTVLAPSWRRRSAADLVKLLAMAPRHRLARDQVSDALWPGLDAEAGATNTRRAAHFARHALGAPDAVVISEGWIELAPAWQVVTDVAEFERAEAEARRDGAAGVVERAIALYAGDLLPDDRYADWCTIDRERLRRSYLDLLADAGRFDDLVAAEPVNEPAHRMIMQARIDSGDRAGAIRQFEALRAALHDLGLSPDAASVSLYELALNTQPPDAPTAVERARALLAWGIVHWERADLAEAHDAAGRVKALAIDAGLGREFVEASQLLGLIAYAQGSWREQFGQAVVEAIQRTPEMAPFVFDAHVCMSEFSLHQPDGISAALGLSQRIRMAADEAGSIEGRALALLLLGEARLLARGASGPAQAALLEAVELHERIPHTSGAAVATERWAEALDLLGDTASGRRLHRHALELAVDSPMAGHLVPFVYGGLIRAAAIDDVPTLLAEEVSASAGLANCETCAMGLHVYAVAALAKRGDLGTAHAQLAVAERTATRWSGGAWGGSVLEAQAAVRSAEGTSSTDVSVLLERAARTFDAVGRRADAARCRRAGQSALGQR